VAVVAVAIAVAAAVAVAVAGVSGDAGNQGREGNLCKGAKSFCPNEFCSNFRFAKKCFILFLPVLHCATT
jgi:hypothetical protein